MGKAQEEIMLGVVEQLARIAKALETLCRAGDADGNIQVKIDSLLDVRRA
jgi:hypothetical protein